MRKLVDARTHGRAAVQAEENGIIQRNPAKTVDKAAHEATEKGILTKAESAAVCALPLDNPRQLLPVLLGLCCGMRRGEIRGAKENRTA